MQKHYRGIAVEIRFPNVIYLHVLDKKMWSAGSAWLYNKKSSYKDMLFCVFRWFQDFNNEGISLQYISVQRRWFQFQSGSQVNCPHHQSGYIMEIESKRKGGSFEEHQIYISILPSWHAWFKFICIYACMWISALYEWFYIVKLFSNSYPIINKTHSETCDHRKKENHMISET